MIFFIINFVRAYRQYKDFSYFVKSRNLEKETGEKLEPRFIFAWKTARAYQKARRAHFFNMTAKQFFNYYGVIGYI